MVPDEEGSMQKQSKAIILARVSSKTQEDEGYSLDSQLKLMRGYCKTNRLTVIKEFKIAETASKEQRRKIFHELVAYITSHGIYHLVVEKTDRLTRNFKDATTIDAWLERDERRMLHMVKESLVLHKNARSDAKFMWNIYLSVAKKYTDNLREEAMKGWAEKLAQGWLPAPPPPGYVTVLRDGKKIHIPNPETYKSMPRVFQLALIPGYTLERLSDEMAAMGVLTRRGRPFARSYVTKMLTNPFYIGINRMDGRDYPGAQEPIIKKALFKAVQEKLQDKPYRNGRKVKHDPVFRGMITCEACGYSFSWAKHKGRFYGSCGRRRQECRGKSFLREDRVENLVVMKLEEMVDPKGRILAKLKAALQIVEPQSLSLHRLKMIDELGVQLSRLKRMDNQLYEDKLAGLITEGMYLEKRGKFASQAAEFAGRLELLRESMDIAKPEMPLLRSDNKIADLYLRGSPNQKRVILSAAFAQITAQGEHVNLSVLALL
jgi:DNA invertase Pin-like site-specific DNA recombinase